MRNYLTTLVLSLSVCGCAAISAPNGSSTDAPSSVTTATQPDRVTRPTPQPSSPDSREHTNTISTPNLASTNCNLTQESVFPHVEIGQIPILRDRLTNAVLFSSQMQVDTDGAPDAYHPDDIGITHICNGVNVNVGGSWEPNCLTKFNRAKAEDFQGSTKIDFFAMATGSNGVPIIQGNNDPKPGYFVSTSSFKQPGINRNTPQAQLDSNTIPYIVIPGTWQRYSAPGVKLGDFAVVLRKSTGKISYAVVGDTGPKSKLGEGSVALHEALGNDPFMMRYGKRRAMKGIGSRDVLYVIFPNSRKSGEVVTSQLVDTEGARLLEQFGGKQKLLRCSR